MQICYSENFWFPFQCLFWTVDTSQLEYCRLRVSVSLGRKSQLRMSTPSASAHPHILRTKFMSHHHSTPRHASRCQGRISLDTGFFFNRKYCTWEVMYISLFQPLSRDERFLRMWTCKTYLYSFPKPVRPQGTTSAVKDYFSDLRMIFNVLENEHDEPHLCLFG